MDYKIDQHHIYIVDDRGLLSAHIEFQETTAGTYDICRTFVDPALRGKNIASELVEKAISEIHRRGAVVTASCSYAKKMDGRAWYRRINMVRNYLANKL